MAVEESVLIVIRGFRPNNDEPFIYSTWRNSIWFDEKRDAKNSDKWFRKKTSYIKNMIRDPKTNVRIACLKDDPDIIIGYAVFVEDNLEWIYVKTDYRRKGIATLLAKGLETISTPETKIGKSIAQKKNLKENHGHLNGQAD